MEEKYKIFLNEISVRFHIKSFPYHVHIIDCSLQMDGALITAAARMPVFSLSPPFYYLVSEPLSSFLKIALL